MPKIISDEAVFRATLATLIDRGYTGATTKAIAKAAGVNEGTLFRKYGSKPQLVTTAIASYAFQLPPGSIKHTGNLVADLSRASHRYAASIEEDGRLFPVIMSEMARFPELRRTTAAPHQVIGDMASLIQRFIASGDLITDESPLQAVASLWGPLNIINMLQHGLGKFAPPPLEIDAHVLRFVRGRKMPTP